MAPALLTAVAFRLSPCPSLLLSWLSHAWLCVFSKKYPVPPDSWACRWWPLPRTQSTSWFPPLILDEPRSVCQELSFRPFSPLFWSALSHRPDEALLDLPASPPCPQFDRSKQNQATLLLKLRCILPGLRSRNASASPLSGYGPGEQRILNSAQEEQADSVMGAGDT